jgi:VanZ family protein
MKYFSIIVTTGLILLAVLWPASQLPQTGYTGGDKIVHVFMFFVWSLSAQFDFPDRKLVWRILMAGVSFGLLTEVLQLQTKTRSFDWLDWLADSIGLLLALLSGKIVLPILSKIGFFRWLTTLKKH